MKIAALVARYLVGLIMTAAGISGFLIHTPPPQPGLAGAFQDVFFQSHWVLFVDGIELLCGLALLSGYLIPLALLALAAIIYNMYVFHILMQPIGVVAPIVMTVLWFLIASRYRSRFLPLLELRPKTDAELGLAAK